MITSYKSQRHNNLGYLLRLWLLNCLVLVAGLLLLGYLFPSLFSYSTSFWLFIVPILSISSWIDLAQKDRINEIIIDGPNRLITFKYYDINEAQKEKSLSFDQTKIKVSDKKSLFGNVIEVYFFTGRRNIFYVSRSKDGFSFETMNEIKTYLEAVTNPINV
jgi:hypothetical protein